MGRYTLTISEIIDLGYDIFSFDYDVPEGVTKQELQDAFIATYNNREIAYETVEQWGVKFEFKWKLMVKKYWDIFTHVLEPFDSYKSKSKTTQLIDGETKAISESVPTPVTEVPSETDIPNIYNRNQAENETEVETISDVKRQHESDVQMLNRYVRFEPVLMSFVKEFNNLMYARY